MVYVKWVQWTSASRTSCRCWCYCKYRNSGRWHYGPCSGYRNTERCRTFVCCWWDDGW